MEPMKLKMNSAELKKRMKEIEKEEQETLEKEKIANDEFLEEIRNKEKIVK